MKVLKWLAEVVCEFALWLVGFAIWFYLCSEWLGCDEQGLVVRMSGGPPVSCMHVKTGT